MFAICVSLVAFGVDLVFVVGLKKSCSSLDIIMMYRDVLVTGELEVLTFADVCNSLGNLTKLTSFQTRVFRCLLFLFCF